MDEYLFPQISGFGLSKILHTNDEILSSSSTNCIKGTPVYVAPETWDKGEYSPAVDVYAFGFIKYEIMTNEEPFKNCTKSYNSMVFGNHMFQSHS